MTLSIGRYLLFSLPYLWSKDYADGFQGRRWVALIHRIQLPSSLYSVHRAVPATEAAGHSEGTMWLMALALAGSRSSVMADDIVLITKVGKGSIKCTSFCVFVLKGNRE